MYRGKKCHDADFDHVIERGRKYGVQKYLFAAGYIEDAKISLELSLKSDDFFATIGVHPCRANEPFKLTKERNEEIKLDQEKLDGYFD